MRIGVLGGTFDPIHLGHMILAETARTSLALEKVIFVPAGDPWRKAGRTIAPAEHRLEMTRLAIADNADFELDDSEVRRDGPSYTVETLAGLKERLPGGTELFFLLGEDALADLPYWRDPAGIAALARIAVAPREGTARPTALPFPEDRLVAIDMPYVSISSTWLRERVGKGLGLRYLVPEGVEAYIRDNGLYS